MLSSAAGVALLSAGIRPDITGPFFVATIDLFDFDLSTEKPMAHDMDGMATAADLPLCYPVTAIIQYQIKEGYWKIGDAAKVTIAMANATMGGTCTYLVFESASLSSEPC